MSSLQHILASEPTPSNVPIQQIKSSNPSVVPLAPMPAAKEVRSHEESDAPSASAGNGESTPSKKARDGGRDGTPAAGAPPRRSAAAGVINSSSVFSGNKMQHLKKDDGVPLWRKDIQYDFLRYVFDDKTRCFTKYSDKSTGHTFATIYVDAMASSSKTSKILKEKLLLDPESAVSMAMVCLLVNVGRMNTTLNFFPEMRAQLRTYHSIPALQAHQSPTAYKSLQDAPRLKSILKGAAEDEPHPVTLAELTAKAYPRTNPVNLLFILSQAAPKVSDAHFVPPRELFDLFTRTTLSSASRGRAFLWLIWWYLESDFTAAASARNPFGPGEFAEEDKEKSGVPKFVPALESLNEQQAELENVDTPVEIRFGEDKKKERILILSTEPSPAMTAAKRPRKDKSFPGLHNSDDEMADDSRLSLLRHQHNDATSDYTRSPSPVGSRSFHSSSKPAGDMRINNLLNSDDLGPDHSPPRHAVPAASGPVKKGPGRGNWRRGRGRSEAGPGRSSLESSHHVPLLPNTNQLSFVSDGPAAHGSPGGSFAGIASAGGHVPTPSYQASKRTRGLTQHQNAMNNHRRQQIEYNLDRRIRRIHIRAAAAREQKPALLRAWARIRALPVDYDSEGETNRVKREKLSAKDSREHHRGPTGANGTSISLDDELAPASGHAGDSWPPRVIYAGFAADGADVGEEVKSLTQTFRRVMRRTDRWASRQMGVNVKTRLEAEKLRAEREVAKRELREKQALEVAPDDEDVEEEEEEIEAPRVVKRRRRAAGGDGRKRARVSSRVEVVESKEEPMVEDDDGGGEDDGAMNDDDGGEMDEDDKELLDTIDVEDSEADDDDDDEMDD